MKPEIIILILNIYHPWNTMEPEQTETIVIPNDEYADLNAQNLISMFIREVLEINYLIMQFKFNFLFTINVKFYTIAQLYINKLLK